MDTSEKKSENVKINPAREARLLKTSQSRLADDINRIIIPHKRGEFRLYSHVECTCRKHSSLVEPCELRVIRRQRNSWLLILIMGGDAVSGAIVSSVHRLLADECYSEYLTTHDGLMRESFLSTVFVNALYGYRCGVDELVRWFWRRTTDPEDYLLIKSELGLVVETLNYLWRQLNWRNHDFEGSRTVPRFIGGTGVWAGKICVSLRVTIESYDYPPYKRPPEVNHTYDEALDQGTRRNMYRSFLLREHTVDTSNELFVGASAF